MLVAATSVAAAPVRPSSEQIMSCRVRTPPPDYPAEARARRATGSGVYKIHFIAKTGTVRYVQIVKSTGDSSLAAAAVTAFKQWRFKAGVLPTMRALAQQPAKEPYVDEDFVVKVPVTFALGGKAQLGGQFASPR
jgi:TonB family protein